MINADPVQINQVLLNLCTNAAHIFFPLTEHEPEDESEIDKGLPGGKECILFVDDEGSLVDVGRQILARLGYEIVTETDSVKALDIFKEDPDRFDLVITDMTMPKMTGEMLVGEVRNIRSEMPIILCTGYSDQIDGEKIVKMGIDAFIMKPLEMGDLANKLREILDRK